MVVLDEDGPFPIAARVIERVETGAIPAPRLDNARSRKTLDGYDLLLELERAGKASRSPSTVSTGSRTSRAPTASCVEVRAGLSADVLS